MALEDIGIFWDLPNYDECKHYYFQVVDLDQGQGREGSESTFPLAASPDHVIEDHYGWKVSQQTNQLVYRTSGILAAASLGVAFLC